MGDALPSARRDRRPVDVCLIRSPTVTSIGAVGQDAVPPLGLAYIAGSLLEAGHRVSAFDGVGDAVHQYSRVPWHPLFFFQAEDGIRDADVTGVQTCALPI